MQKYSDQDILNGISEQKKSVIIYIYKKMLPSIRQIVYKYGGNDHDARDVFQEGLVMIFQRVKRGDLVIDHSFETYFIMSCVYIWFRHKKRVRNYYTTSNIEKLICHDNSDNAMEYGCTNFKGLPETESLCSEKLLMRNFRKLPADCKRVIMLFLKNINFRQISTEMKYSGEDYARRKKYLSLKKLSKMIQNDPDYYLLHRTVE